MAEEKLHKPSEPVRPPPKQALRNFGPPVVSEALQRHLREREAEPRKWKSQR